MGYTYPSSYSEYPPIAYSLNFYKEKSVEAEFILWYYQNPLKSYYLKAILI